MDTDFEKYLYEEFKVECDFEKNLATGEELVVASCEIKIYDWIGTDKTSDMYVSSSIAVADGEETKSMLQAKIKGGTADNKYTVKFKVKTNATSANYFQQDKTLYVYYENTG